MVGNRGRPRAFDENLAVRAALNTFVGKGLHEATLDDLAAEMGINKPSLYGAFGDKKQLFRRVLHDYRTHIADRMTEAFVAGQTLDETLSLLLEGAMGLFLPHSGDRRGCLVVSITSAAAGNDDTLRAELAAFIEEADLQLRSLLTAHYEDVLRMRDLSPELLALAINNIVFALAFRARAGASRAELRRIGAEMLKLVAV